MNEQNNKEVIDLSAIFKTLLSRKKVFFIMWPIVFILSCVWIFPEPRFYTSDVSLAPESGGDNVAGGLTSLASQFGVNLGGGSTDAIYPLLYPDLMSSNDFIISLLGIQVQTQDGSYTGDYYTYMTKHQKKNEVTAPFKKLKGTIGNLFAKKKDPGTNKSQGTRMNAFRMSEKDFNLIQSLKTKITCSVDKKTNVITIQVKDQDPVIAATMADSARQHLQDYITLYRTNKARVDVQHYEQLTVEAKKAYDRSVAVYSSYCDTNQDVMLQSFISKRDELENEMQLKFNTYSAMRTQLEAMRAKLQEKTPAFTILQSATVPVKPAGPKRMIFVLGMLIFSTFAASLWLVRKEIFTKPQPRAAE